jgi:hypothetical protein
MKPVKLYKRGCDPYTVASQEALDFHLHQGWVENEADVEKVVVVIPLTAPYDVLKEGVIPAGPSAEVKSLKEALAAKDQQIADMQEDFEEVVKELNATIKTLKGDAPDFGLPAAHLPIVPPEGPTNQQLRDQLDAAGVKHTPRDNKTTLLAMVEAIPKVKVL